MNEEQLRGVVRAIVARHLGHPATATATTEPFWKTHVSHLRLPVSSGQQADGPCFVEPATACHHCGYCQSLGH